MACYMLHSRYQDAGWTERASLDYIGGKVQAVLTCMLKCVRFSLVCATRSIDLGGITLRWPIYSFLGWQ